MNHAQSVLLAAALAFGLTTGAFSASEPPSLDDSSDAAAEPKAADTVLEAAKAAFAASHANQCTPPPGGNASPAEPEAYTISYNQTSDEEGGTAREARLFRFFCSTGAYNENHVYYLHEEMDGLRELHFATPELDIRYENDDAEGAVEGIGIVGYFAEDRLVNSSYDEATTSITSHPKWRGAGDASSSGNWIFRNGEFALVRYEVDASYDGETNPETILDYDTAP